MKMKALSLVVGAALGASAMQAGADALLAPYFKQGPGIITTQYLMKTRGNGVPNQRWLGAWANSEHWIHAYYFWKPDTIPGSSDMNTWGFSRQTTPCTRNDTYGKFSSWDFVVADVATGTLYPNGVGGKFPDQTDAPTFGVNNVEGFMIFVEKDLSLNPVGAEGDFSGTTYVFSLTTGSALTTKMLNNPNSQDGNVWDNAHISKNIFDISWWPLWAADTMWPTIVVGNNMLNTPNSSWGGAVTLKAYPWVGNLSPLSGQVYNNDERLYSGQTPKKIVCAGTVTRTEIVVGDAELQTRGGGWGRWQAYPENDNLCDNVTVPCSTSPPTVSATGAFMQKFEYFWGNPGTVGWSIETSGNTNGLPAAPGSNANLPY